MLDDPFSALKPQVICNPCPAKPIAVVAAFDLDMMLTAPVYFIRREDNPAYPCFLVHNGHPYHVRDFGARRSFHDPGDVVEALQELVTRLLRAGINEKHLEIQSVRDLFL